MNSSIRLIIKYFDLKRYLTDSLGMPADQAVRTIRKLRAMKPDVRRVFLKWFDTRDLPEEPLHGVYIGALMEQRQLNPVAAFLAVDWVAKEPDKARSALVRGRSGFQPSEEDQAMIRALAKEKGWDLDRHAEEPIGEEDSSDLEEPDEE